MSGNSPSDRERFIRWVIGWTRTSMQDLRSFVGMISREQEESVDERTNFRISSVEAGARVDNWGDVVG